MRPTMFEMLRRTWQPKGLKEIIVQEGSATEKLFISLLIVLTCFSIRGICARAKKRVFFTELYHFAVILTLAALSATYPIIPSIISFMVLFYIVIEIIIWTIFDIFVESKLPELQGRRNSLRAFLWAIYCYLVVIWAYALYFVISGKIVDGNQNSLPGNYIIASLQLPQLATEISYPRGITAPA